MYINLLVYFMTGLSYVLQQPSTAGPDKTKADIAKKELSFLLILLGYAMNDNWTTCLMPDDFLIIV